MIRASSVNTWTDRGKHSSSFVVGAEGGHLFRCFLRESRARVQPPADAADLWSPEAWALLARVRSSDRDALRKVVERHARDSRLSQIAPRDVYDAHPPQDKLFPSPIDFAYEAHGA